MDTQTLIVTNVLFFALYAGVMLVNARTVGGSRGAMWFAGSNLSRGAAMLLWATMGWRLIPLRVTEALAGFFAVAGLLMLHQSFAALLERGALLRWVQYGLLGVMTAGALYLLWRPPTGPTLMMLVCAILGVQGGLVASVVFRFSGKEIGLAGWLTGVALTLYSAIMLMQALVLLLLYRSPEYPQAVGEMERIWLVGCLMTNGAVAFGYMFLSTAKFRLELMWRAQIDELTGLLNRWALKRMTMHEIGRCQRAHGMNGALSMVMMDLDGLKGINDECGHGCGDVVLQAVAGVLQETVREQDSVARMGGDEFCVLLPETNLAEAVTVAERLRAQVDELVIQYRGETVRIRASLGVTSSEHCGLTWQSLMDHSDMALYQAKRAGKNRVVGAEAIEPSGDEAGAVVVVKDRRRSEGGD